MKKIIELFNKKYGKQYGCFDDGITSEEAYKIYKIIKTLCPNDEEIMTALEKVKLPEPKTSSEVIEKIMAEHEIGTGTGGGTIIEEDPESTLDKLLEYGLVGDAMMLDDGTYLTDENGNLFQI